jgi:hypothetical protein
MFHNSTVMEWNTVVLLYFWEINTKFCHQLHKAFINIPYKSGTRTLTVQWLNNWLMLVSDPNESTTHTNLLVFFKTQHAPLQSFIHLSLDQGKNCSLFSSLTLSDTLTHSAIQLSISHPNFPLILWPSKLHSHCQIHPFTVLKWISSTMQTIPTGANYTIFTVWMDYFNIAA